MGESLMRAADGFYRRIARPLLFTAQPDTAHAITTRMLALLDTFPFLAKSMSGDAVNLPTIVGGVTLASPVMVAAGLVKGYYGFADETAAVAAARSWNILPGWRSVPIICGAVEIGSFTRYPRFGNPAPVLWRDVSTRSTQNRVGLKNPGALAASVFLESHQVAGKFGISIATTPGESDPAVQAAHVSESVRFFIGRGVRPAWFTVNISCPNTEDDPRALQTEQLAAQVCEAAVAAADGVPVWAKISPDLGDFQYQTLIETFGQAGVKAVVATNTLASPVAGKDFTAGLAGGLLFNRALTVVLKLFALRERHGYKFDIVGCGGVMDGNGVRAYTDAGAQAVQVWSALVYRGPFAPVKIAREYAQLNESQG